MSGSIAVVLAPPLDSYPTLPYRGEGALLAARRTEPCACGIHVVQRAGEDVTDVVDRHNQTLAHRSWRDRSGL